MGRHHRAMMATYDGMSSHYRPTKAFNEGIELFDRAIVRLSTFPMYPSKTMTPLDGTYEPL